MVGPPGRRARPGRNRARRGTWRRCCRATTRCRETRLGVALVDRYDRHGGVIPAVAGFDATFSAPKSVSVWWALTGDPGLVEAHDAAVAAVLAHLERYGATTRVRVNGGRQHPDTLGLVMATFGQATSREDDPQLHTHVVISAKVRDSGRAVVGAGRPLPERQAAGPRRPVPVGAARRAGPPLRGGVGPDRRTVRPRSPAHPPSWWRCSPSAPPRSTPNSPSSWTPSGNGKDETPPVGSGPPSPGRRPPTPARPRPAPRSTTWWAGGVTRPPSWAGPPPGCVEHLRTAARADADRRAAHPRPGPRSPVDGRLGLDARRRAPGRLRPHPRRVRGYRAGGGRPRSSGRRTGWSSSAPAWTRRHRAAPPGPRTAAPSGSPPSTPTSPTSASWPRRNASWPTPSTPTPSRPARRQRCDRSGLDVLQADAAAGVAGHDPLVVVVGPAGTGKTTALAAAVADLRAQRRAVFGVAPTAKAAQVLSRETGMNADTVAKLLHEWSRSRRAHPCPSTGSPRAPR